MLGSEPTASLAIPPIYLFAPTVTKDHGIPLTPLCWTFFYQREKHDDGYDYNGESRLFYDAILTETDLDRIDEEK